MDFSWNGYLINLHLGLVNGYEFTDGQLRIKAMNYCNIIFGNIETVKVYSLFGTGFNNN